MWNMPRSIVEATAFHHEPPLGEQQNLTPLAAVHIANVLEHELRPSDEFRVAPIINSAFLTELGLVQRLPVWRARTANRGAAYQLPDVESVETYQPESVTPVLESTVSSRTANNLPGPVPATRTTTSEQPSEDTSETIPVSGSRQRRWVYAGVAAGVLFLLALWLRTQADLDESPPVYARTTATSQPPAVASSTPLRETVHPAAPQVPPATAASKPAPAASASSVSELAISRPAAVPTPAIVSPATVGNAPPPPSLPPRESALPDLRLNGIIYTVARPAAILNGQTVHVGDEVSGATVISIRQTDVTVQIGALRKTYTLR
jgi:hypothetical protein